MTAIPGAAAAVTGAASGIGRALAIELAARGCDLALADRDEAGLAAVAAEIGKSSSRKVSVHRVDVSEPGQIADFAKAAIAAHPGAEHPRQQCRRRPARPVQRNRSGADGLADEHQFLGRGAFDARLPGPSRDAARGPYRQPLEHLRHRRAAGADRLRRGQIRGTRLFRSRSATNCRWRQARCAFRWCIPAAS